jgi:pimeloyl-ACP methyl ester carboxylesterase
MPTHRHQACDRKRLSFDFSTGRLPSVSIKGWLTVPERLRSPALQVLVHGGTYSHLYWDWPQQPETYSYVEWAKERGYATLALDCMGTGESDHPPSSDIDIHAQALAVQAAITALRNGREDNRFSHFILVGHSMGCTIASLAARLEPVDALVLTGSVPLATGSAANAIIAGDDGAICALRPGREIPGLDYLDEGYVTIDPAYRKPWMYCDAGADPAIVAYDLAHPDVITLAELATVKDYRQGIIYHDVPVLFHVGDQDVLEYDPHLDDSVRPAVAAMMARLPGNYAYEITPAAGHCLTLHRNAREGYAFIGRWVDALDLDTA